LAVTTQSLADNFDVSAKLQRDGRHDCGITRIHVCAAVALVIREKDLGQTAVLKSADRGGVAKARNLDFKRLSEAPVGKTLTGTLITCIHNIALLDLPSWGAPGVPPGLLLPDRTLRMRARPNG
jgi:hypothetical protein